MDAFIGEIRLMAIDFAPAGWGFCDGTSYMMNQFMALFAVIGRQYTPSNIASDHFCVPNLSGRVARQAQTIVATRTSGGNNAIQLTTTQLPSHTHALNGEQIGAASRVAAPTGNLLSGAVLVKTAGNEVANAFVPGTAKPALTAMNAKSLAPFPGLGQAMDTRQPYLALGYFICMLDGAFPERP